ncbi:MAG: hypothetical protein U1D55_15020 [Phycisphaerae bacterium]
MIRVVVGVVLFSLAVSAALAQSAVETALKQIPDDAAMVFVIPNVEKLVTDAGAFAKAAGGNISGKLQPAELISELHLLPNATGVDFGAPLVVAMNPTLLLPTTICGLKDAAAWKEAAGAKPGAGESLTLGEKGSESYASLRGSLLIHAMDEGAVEDAAKSSGKIGARIAKLAGDQLRECDALLFIDTPAWQLQVNQGLAMAEGFMSMASLSNPSSAGSSAIFTWALHGVRAVVGDARSTLVTLSVGADAVRLRHFSEFPTETKVGAFLKGIRRGDRDLLRGLPAGRAVLCFANEWEQSADALSIQEDATRAMLSGLPPNEETEKLKGEFAQLRETFRSLNGFAASIALSEDGKSLVIAGTYLTRQGRALLEKFPAMWRTGFQVASSAAAPLHADLDAQREKIGDADALRMKFNITGEQTEMLDTLKRIYGEDSTIYATTFDDGVRYALGPGEAARRKFEHMTAADAAALDTDERVRAALKTISPKPQLLVLIDLMKAAEAATVLARGAGAPMPEFKATGEPPELAAAAIYLDEQAIRTELRVPTKPIRTLIDAQRAAAETGPGY